MNGGKFFNNAGYNPNGMNATPNNMNGQGGFVGVEAAKNGDFSAVSNSAQSAPQGQVMSQNSPMTPVNSGVGMQPVQPAAAQPMMQPVQPIKQPIAPQQPVQQPMMQPVAPVQPVVPQQPMMQSVSPVQPQPMSQPQPVVQPQMMSNQPMMQQPVQTVAPQQPIQPANPIQNGVIQPSIQANPMDVASVPTTPQQQTIVISNGGGGVPSFNNSLNGISPLEPPVVPPVNSDLKMKTKLKFDFKKLIIIIVALLVVAAVVLCLCCYKVVSCKGEETVYEAKVTAEAKAYFWFGKINKIVTIKTIDMKGLNKEEKETITNLYKDMEDNKNEDIQFKGDKIIITTTTKPEDEEDADVTKEDFIDAFETYDFVCK